MKRIFKKYIFYITLIAVLAITFFIGFRLGINNVEVSSKEIFSVDSATEIDENLDFTVFWNTWNVINNKFRPASSTLEFDDRNKILGATAGLVESLNDPYTVFFEPEDAEVFQDNINGNFSGVGMRIDKKNDEIVVISPLKNSPAEKAGVLSGDRIIAIDGNRISGIKLEEAVKKIRGEIGTSVVLTMVRSQEDKEEKIDIEIFRDNIEIPVIETKLTDEGVFVIELYSFSATSPNLFRDALNEFRNSLTDNLVLDLRGNAGGFLEAAIDIASWFLPEGEIIVTEDFGKGNEDRNRVHRSRGYNAFDDNLNFVILVDIGSASASEILAGALQQHDKAELVGTKTFGKGSVQELVSVDNEGSSLKITVAQWLTPDGSSISDGGLSPDYDVKYTIEDNQKGIDPQLNKAIEILTK